MLLIQQHCKEQNNSLIDQADIKHKSLYSEYPYFYLISFLFYQCTSTDVAVVISLYESIWLSGIVESTMKSLCKN